MRNTARILRAASIALALMVSVLAADAAQAQGSIFNLRNRLIDFLLDQLGTPGSFELTTQSVETPPEGGTALVGFAISDEEGAWLTAERVTFRFDADRLLSGVVDITEIRITGLEMTRLPTQPADPATAAPPSDGAELDEAGEGATEGFAWPRSPLTLFVRSFVLDGAVISDRVAPQRIAFSAEGSARDEGPEQTLTLSLRRADAIEGAISIAYERRFDDDTLALTLDADEAAGGLAAALFGLPEDSASRVRLEAGGPPSDWRMTLTASSDRVFDATGSAVIDYSERIAAELDIVVTPGAALDPTLAGALSPQATLRGSVQENEDGVVRVQRIELSSRDASAHFDGLYNRRDGAFDFQARVALEDRFSDLTSGVDFVGVIFEGRVRREVGASATAVGQLRVGELRTTAFDAERLDARASATIDAGRVVFSLDGDGRGMRLDRVGPDVLDAAALRLAAVVEGGRIAFDAAELTSRALVVSLTGSAPLDATVGDAALNIAAEARDLRAVAAAYGADLEGALSAQGRLFGPLDALVFEGETRVDRIVYRPAGGAPIRAGGAVLAARISLSPTPSGPIALTIAESDLGPLEARLVASLERDRLRMTPLEGSALGAQGDGSVEIALSDPLAVGALRLRAASLRPLGRLLGLDVDGAGEVALTLFADGGRQGVDLRVEGRRLRVSGVPVAGLNGTARIADIATLRGIDAQARVTGVDFGVGAPVSAVVNARGSGDALAVTVAGEAETGRLGAETRAVAVDAAADLALTSRGVDLRLRRFDLGLGAERLRLREPSRILIAGGAVVVGPLAFEGPRDASLRLTLRSGARGVAIEAAVARFDLTALRDLGVAPVGSGTLDGSLSLDAPARAGRLEATIRRFTPQGADDVAPLDLRLEGDWRAGRLDLALRGDGAFAEPIVGRLSLPLVGGPGGFAVPPGGGLDGMLSWSGDLAELWALAPSSDHLLAGPVEIDLRIDGTVAAPRLSGGLSLRDGRYDNLALGAILTDVAATSSLGQDGALTVDVTARDGGEGQVSARVALGLAAPFPIEARATITQAVLLRRDDARARLSGDLVAAGPIGDVLISGALTIDAAEIDISATQPEGVVDLGEIRFVGEGAPPPADETERTRSGGPRLELTVSAPGTVRVFGRGLESLWGVDLAVAGFASDPRLRGAVESASGRLDLLGVRFDLSRGRIGFDGSTDPSLDIVFTRRANDIEGRIEVSGRGSDPRIGFASTPNLPEEEVLPRTIFGRARQALSPSEAAQLAGGVATLLTGRSGIAGVLGGTGVDLGASGANVGGYVGGGAYVGVEQNFDGSGGSVTIELEVLDNVEVDAEVGQDGGASVGAGVRYEW